MENMLISMRVVLLLIKWMYLGFMHLTLFFQDIYFISELKVLSFESFYLISHAGILDMWSSFFQILEF